MKNILSKIYSWIGSKTALIRSKLGTKTKIIILVVLLIFSIRVFAINRLYFTFLRKDFQGVSEQTKILQAIKLPTFPNRVCDIANYGAKKELAFLSTQAINAAIDDCSAQGGGTVLVPRGQWLTGAIHLKSNINLEIADGAELMFSPDRQNYLPVVFSRFQGMEYYNFSPLIYANDCQNVAVSGKGKLLGNGQPWRDWSDKKSTPARELLLKMANDGVPATERVFGENDGFRPSFVAFVNCQNVLVKDIHLEDGPMWNIHLVYSKNVTVDNVNVESLGINGDGIVVDSSDGVLIKNSSLHTSDDSISIKSGLEKDGWRVGKPAENIVIQNCKILEGHGGVAIGSEMSGSVRNVFIENNSFISANQGVVIKSMLGRGGVVENILVKNNYIERAVQGILITMDYNSRISSSKDNLPIFRNIFISGVDLKKDNNAVVIEGEPGEDLIHDIYVKDISGSTTRAAVKVSDARNVFLRNISVPVISPTFNFFNSQNIDLVKYICKKDSESCIKIEGDHSGEIATHQQFFW